MLGDFDLHSAARAIMEAEGVIEWETVSLEQGAFETGGADVVIRGDVTQGALIRKAGSVLVIGTLEGSQRWPCRIEVAGDLVILGEAKHATVSARSIRVGGAVSNCKLDTQMGLELGADVSECRIGAGDFSPERRQFKALEEAIVQAGRDRDAVDRHRRLEEKRMYKRLETTRISMNFSLGRIILQKRKRIAIDLTPFYEMMGDRSADQVDQALQEFFAKGVVGLLTQANMQFLQNRKNRQTIFQGVVSRLKDLIWFTRTFDLKVRALRGLEAEREGLLEALENRSCDAYIRGGVLPEVAFRFVGPEIDRSEDGEVSVETHMAKLDVTREGIQETDLDGLVSEEALEPLNGLCLGLQEGRIVRVPLGAMLEERV